MPRWKTQLRRFSVRPCGLWLLTIVVLAALVNSASAQWPFRSRRCSCSLYQQMCGGRCAGCDCDGGAAPGEPATDGEPTTGEPATSDLLAGAYGATASSLSATPNVIGDFFGGGVSQATITTTVNSAFHTTGFIVSGSPGDPNAVLVFEANGGSADDFTSMGVGIDVSGDGLPDTFAMTEPLPPNEVPTSPGPGFVFNGGTVAYTVDTTNTTAQDGVFDDGSIWYATYGFSQTMQVLIPNGGGAAVRRIKIAENNSPIPRDRLIFNYNFFNDVLAGVGDVRRYTLGFEKTLFYGLMSLDVRFPYASTLDSLQTVGVPGGSHSEFGNISVIGKVLLYETGTLAVAGGVGVTAPTADDTRVLLPNGTTIARLDNESVHVQPYFGAVWAPGNRWFVQGFLEVDVDTNGNPIAADINGGRLPDVGRLHDATILFADVSAGYWMYRNPCNCGFTGIAPVLELHYATTTQDADAVVGNGISISSVTNRFDVLNMTFGVHALVGDGIVITPGMSIPLRTDDDRQFDFEANVQANWYF